MVATERLAELEVELRKRSSAERIRKRLDELPQAETDFPGAAIDVAAALGYLGDEGLLPSVRDELMEKLSSAAECQPTLLDPQHWQVDDATFAALDPSAMSSWHGGGAVADSGAGGRMLDAIAAIREAAGHAAEQNALLLVVL